MIRRCDGIVAAIDASKVAADPRYIDVDGSGTERRPVLEHRERLDARRVRPGLVFR